MEEKPNAVVIGRDSTDKQAIQGDSIDEQIAQCREQAEKDGCRVIKEFPIVESARKLNRNRFDEVINFDLDPANKVKYQYFKNISRFTRGGDIEYLRLKEKLQEGGVQIRDIYGTIRPAINTMAPYGLEYDWSRYYPSQAEETYQANRARDAVRDSLTVMIGAEISYTRLGYWSRNSVFGFKNEKVETMEHGKRNILVPFDEEAKYIKEMFRLLDEGKSEKEVVEKLNAQGMRTRKFNHRDRRTKVALGKGGGKPLTVKQLQRMKKKLVYAGIVCEKWTNYQPVVARFKGLVDGQVFNRVNDSMVKIVLLENGADVKVLYGKELEAEKKTIRRLRNNPEYPFKDIRCPVCGWPSKGSASRGKSGKHFPAYHCARGHKSWRVKKSDFHDTIYDFVRRLHMKPSYVRLFEETFLEVWKESRVNLIEESKLAGENVANLLAQQKSTLDSIKVAGSDLVRKALEEDYEKLDLQIKDARKVRTIKEDEEVKMKARVRFAGYFMEHLDELLLDEANPDRQRQLFGLVFEEIPNYEQLVNGTPKLAPEFGLSGTENVSKAQLVDPGGIEPPTLPCHGSVLPVYHGPQFTLSKSKGGRRWD